MVLPLPPRSRLWNSCYEPSRGEKKRSVSKGRNGLCLRSENEGRYASQTQGAGSLAGASFAFVHQHITSRGTVYTWVIPLVIEPGKDFWRHGLWGYTLAYVRCGARLKLGCVGLELFAEGTHIMRADRSCFTRVCLTHCILSSVTGNLLFWGRVCGCFWVLWSWLVLLFFGLVLFFFASFSCFQSTLSHHSGCCNKQCRSYNRVLSSDCHYRYEDHSMGGKKTVLQVASCQDSANVDLETVCLRRFESHLNELCKPSGKKAAWVKISSLIYRAKIYQTRFRGAHQVPLSWPCIKKTLPRWLFPCLQKLLMWRRHKQNAPKASKSHCCCLQGGVSGGGRFCCWAVVS